MLRNPSCTDCPLHSGAKTVCLWGQGPSPNVGMIVGQNPGYREDRIGEPFIGPAGKLLDSLMEQVGLRRADFYVSNAVKCLTPENRPPELEELHACKKYLKDEIREVNPRFILCLGNVALRALTGKSGITSLRGIHTSLHTSFEHGAVVIPTIHPAAGLESRYPAYQQQILEDLRKFKHALEDAYEQPDALEWHYATTQFGMKTNEPIAFDIETDSLDVGTCKVLLLGLDGGAGVCIYKTPEGIEGAAAALEGHVIRGDRVVGHNASRFDRLALWQQTGFEIKCDDTLLADYILRPEKQKRTLEALAMTHLGVPPWKAETRGSLLPSEDTDPQGFAAWVRRCARDVRYTRALFLKYQEEFSAEPALERIYRQILLPASRAYCEIEHRGVPISADNLTAARAEIEAVVDRTRRELVQTALSCGISSFNPNSPVQVAKLLFERLGLPPLGRSTGYGQERTGVETLKTLRNLTNLDDRQRTVIDGMLEFRRNDKLLGTYLRPFADLRDAAGRIYPSYSLTNTVTGRTASFNPNIQNVPRDPRVRRCIAAPEGKMLVSADFSAIELRIAAWLAPERRMLAAFRNGEDPHLLLAADIVGCAPKDVTPDQRTNAKPANFGSLYGADWPTLQRLALTDYDLVWSAAQAQFAWERFHTRWPDYQKWYEHQLAAAERNGFVRSPIGRKFSLGNIYSSTAKVRAEALRCAVNYPIQSFGSADMKFIALIIMEAEGWHTIIDGHDSLVFEEEADCAEACAARAKVCMEEDVPQILRDRFEVDLTVPIIAEVKILNEWA